MRSRLLLIAIFFLLGTSLFLGSTDIVQAQLDNEACVGLFCGGFEVNPGDRPETFADFVERIIALILTAVPILMILSLLTFIYGATKLIYNSGDERKISDGKAILVWGVIALFVMVSVWGIVAFIQVTFGLR